MNAGRGGRGSPRSAHAGLLAEWLHRRSRRRLGSEVYDQIGVDYCVGRRTTEPVDEVVLVAALCCKESLPELVHDGFILRCMKDRRDSGLLPALRASRDGVRIHS